MSVNPSASAAPANPDQTTPVLTEPEFTHLQVARKRTVADDIYLFELHHPDGAPLTLFTAGSHLTVQVPNGVRRNYSLCSNPADRYRYQIAVKRDTKGRGGSISMADDVQEGQLLPVSAPRNNFELAERAASSIFIAGGIGITPILSMMRALKSAGNSDFTLYYCTRDAAGTAFLGDIALEFPGQAHIHHDHGDINQALDLWEVFERPTGAHVYCCGPQGLMDSVADMTGHWPSGTVHFESFGVDAKAFAANTPFTARLARTGGVVEVSAGQTLLEALRSRGVHVTSSCESGTCGSCKTRLLGGTAEHRDMVLTDE